MLNARRLGKWSLRLVLALLAFVALYVGLLVFPSPLFAHEARFEGYRVYSDEPVPAGFERVIAEAADRVAAMEHTSDRNPPRIYLCGSRKLYSFFAFLTRKNPRSLAIGLRVANEMFVSTRRVEDFEQANGGRMRHTRFEGNPAEVVAHEIAHFNSIDALGFRRHLAQPVWKSEGWAEYQANLAAIHADSEYDLRERIRLLFDDRSWGSGGSLARDLWEWQLLVEFLGEEDGFRLADLSDDEVTRSDVHERMTAWYRMGPIPEPTD